MEKLNKVISQQIKFIYLLQEENKKLKERLKLNGSDILNITVSEKSHNKVVLTNKNGNEFQFNPISKNGESLFDFLFK